MRSGSAPKTFLPVRLVETISAEVAPLTTAVDRVKQVLNQFGFVDLPLRWEWLDNQRFPPSFEASHRQANLSEKTHSQMTLPLRAMNLLA